jgi:hypothetical protein
MIPLRHANEHWACLLVGVDRKLPGSVEPARMTLMYGPAVRCKRFVDLVVSGLASMYPAFDWSICSGPSWISARVRSH